MIIGVDEVGRGCWAGPLVAGAVLLLQPIEGLADSKTLSKKQRENLAESIYLNAEVGLGWVTPKEVDEVGLTEAVRLAMRRAVEQISASYQEVIIDGNYNYLPDLPSKSIVKADGSIPAVSAASIVAKVARDDYMAQLDEAYAAWEFASHVGYGTTRHIELIKRYGVSDIHRRSYKPIKAFLA